MIESVKSTTINESNYLIDLLRSDGSVIINKNLMHNIGTDCAIMYSELLSKYRYFADRGQIQDGTFYNTIEDMWYDTGLSAHQQRKAIKKLTEFGLIECKVKGIPPVRHFKIIQDESIIKKYLIPFRRNRQKLSTNCEQPAQMLNNLTIESEKIEQLNVKKFNTNNTKVIILSNNTKLVNGSPKKDFNEINKKIVNNLLIKNRDKFPCKEFPYFNYNEKDVGKIINHYLLRYELKFLKPHPILKMNYWQRIINDLFINPVEPAINFKEDGERIIDLYFNTNFDKNVDFNILHFATDGILENRFWENTRQG